MSDASDETAVDAASAFMNADVFYNSEPEVPTEAGESPEVEEEVEADEAETETETETETTDDSEDDSKPYQFDEESGEYIFKAGGKEVKANTDKLIEFAQKGIGFEKKTAQVKRSEEQRAQEHQEVLKGVKQREAELESLIEGLSGLLGEEQLDEDLLDADPSEYIRQKERIAKRQEKIAKAKAELEGRKQSEANAVANREFKQLKEVMGWETPEEVTEGFNVISNYCQELGMTSEDMKSILNHKVYLALSEAAKYRQLQAKKDKVIKEVKSAPKSVKSKKASAPPKERSAADILYGT